MPPTKEHVERPLEQTVVAAEQHPSVGRGFAYSQEMRLLAMSAKDEGLEDEQILMGYREQKKYPSKRTTRRWRRRRLRWGHIRRFRRTGNGRATVLRGHDLFLLAYYRAVWPKARHFEINAFLYNATQSPVPRFFDPAQLTRAEDSLGLSRKRGSTTARQAVTPRNLTKRFLFWHMPYPIGIADIAPEDMIDLDEAAIFLETANRKDGKAYIGCRVREEGPYGHSEKWTLTMAIMGCPILRGRWHDFEQKAGTTVGDMVLFIRRILDTIGPGTPARRFCFLMDNLSAHKHPHIAAMIHMAGHRLVFRPPYYPVDGPIEYAFDTIQVDLTLRLHDIDTPIQLQAAVDEIIARMLEFLSYFRHCGY